MSYKHKPCLVPGCDRNAHRSANGKKNYCSKHYQRVRKFGDPYVVNAVPSPAIDWVKAHVNYSENECLTWPFHIGRDGYGRVHRPETSSLTTASHLMCEFAHGSPPSERHECAHTCGNGNKACVNPLHLYWATPSENQRDRVIHGTSNRGERQWMSKLTESDIVKIRRLLNALTQTEIASRFCVAPSTISNIKTGKHWAWLK